MHMHSSEVYQEYNDESDDGSEVIQSESQSTNIV